MKYISIISSILAAALFLFMTGCPMEFEGGDVWIEPATKNVAVDDSFALDVYADTGDQKLAAYGFEVTFDDSIIDLDDSIGDSGVEEGADGFIAVVNATISGVVSITGFDVEGTGPGEELHILVINFTAVASGSTDVGLTVDTLADEDTDTIGEPSGEGCTVNVSE